MKKSLLAVGLCALIMAWAGMAVAGGVVQGFTWLPYADEFGTDPATIGTKIYVGVEPGVYGNSEDAGIGTTTYDLDNLYCETTYYVAATHYNRDASTIGDVESEKCPEVTFTTEDCVFITFNPMPPLLDPVKLSIPKFKRR